MAGTGKASNHWSLVVSTQGRQAGDSVLDTTVCGRQGRIDISPNTGGGGCHILFVSVGLYCRSHTATTKDRGRSCVV